MSDLGIFPPASALFPGLEDTAECLKHLVRQLSRTDALLWCGRLNLIVSNPNVPEAEAQVYAVDYFYPDLDDRRRLNRWTKAQENPRAVRPFFRAQLLELASWICAHSEDLPGDGETFEQPRNRRLFAQAAAVAASVWAERVYPELRVGGGEASQARRRAMRNLRTSFMENGRSPLPTLALGRGWVLWSKWMPQFRPDVGQLFQQLTGLSLEEYFQCMAALFAERVDIRPEKAREDKRFSGLFNRTFWDSAPHMAPAFDRFMQLEAFTVDELSSLVRAADKPGAHVGLFLKRPVLQTGDGRAVVLDPVSFVEHASVGPLFLMVNGLRDQKAGNELFGQFGKAFEGYVGELLSRRYPSNPVLETRVATGVELTRKRKRLAEMDSIVVTEPREACLIEAKGVFFRVAAGADAEAYLLELTRRYANPGTGPNDRAQGMAQLARFIQELSRGELDEVPAILRDIEVYLPVLLAYDHHIDCPGHGEFLVERFVELLQPDEVLPGGYFRKGALRVATPILLSLDDFEWLESSLRNVSLGKFLKDYAAWAPDRVKSVRDFVAASEYRRRWRAPEAASEAAVEILRALCRKAFGSDPFERRDEQAGSNVEVP